MTSARRRRFDRAMLVMVLAGGVTGTTAVLLVFGRSGPLTAVHVGAAAVCVAALVAKLAILGGRARPARARRSWRSLVAQLGAALAAYTLVTGVLTLLHPAWSDQHLAASFWLGVVAFVHARHFVGGRVGPRPPRGAPSTAAALRRLDAPDVALLDLSLRKGLSDVALASVLRVGPAEVRRRRQAALARLGGAAEPEQRLRQLPAEVWPPPTRPRRTKRLVVVGGGMGGHALAEHVAERGDWQITLLAEEDVEPYNRIALSQLLRQTRTADDLALRSSGWYDAAGIELRVGCPATGIDVHRRRVSDSSGAHHRYDALVLATGSRAFMPPIAGVELPHVVGYRTLRDAERIVARREGVRTALVVGGGPLGLEAAGALSTGGLAVTVVQAAPRLMARQLDEACAAVLRRALARMGVETYVPAEVSEITASEVRLGDGTRVSAELVVVAAGIRPETSLARAAGLEVDRGILVDDQLRTSATDIWAIGECAQHRGVVHGLWPAVAEQARTAAAVLDGEAVSFMSSPAETALKGTGVELISMGRPSARVGQDEIIRSDGREGSYVKLVVAGDRLVGAILLGDTTSSDRLRRLMEVGGPVPVDILDPTRPVRPTARRRRDAPAPGELVCHCMAVSRGAVERAIDRNRLSTVQDVGTATGAGTGCGSCASTLETMLDERRARR